MFRKALFFSLFLLPMKSYADGPIHFKEITKEAGLLEPLQGIMGHGGAWGDLDGDGLIDLFVGGFCDRPNKEYLPAKGPVPTKLFRNLGKGRFEEVQTNLSFFGRVSGAVFADLNNTGFLDLYSANNAKMKSGKNQEEPQKSAQVRFSNLFKNEKGKLVDISEKSGACPHNLFTARNVGVFDYDGDGRLDLFVVEDKFTPKPRSALFRNEGNYQFKDVTKEAGLPENIFGLGLAVADLNSDGKPDIFVGHSNRLFLSQVTDGKTTYREAVELNEVFQWKPLNREDWPCGAAFADLNRDGKLDLVISIHCSQARNKVFLNTGLKNGIPQFRDITKESGLGDTVPVRCPHVEIQDFDNDGWPDIFVSAGWLKDDQFTPLIYRHQGIKNGVPYFLPPQPIREPMVYFPAAPSGDFDNDGRLDLFTINWFQGNHCRLLQNQSAKQNWLDVQIVGKKMNRMGIGAQIQIFDQGKRIGFQEVTTGFGYASGQPAICHFGLGKGAEVEMEIIFPGRPLVKRKSESNRKIIIEE